MFERSQRFAQHQGQILFWADICKYFLFIIVLFLIPLTYLLVCLFSTFISASHSCPPQICVCIFCIISIQIESGILNRQNWRLMSIQNSNKIEKMNAHLHRTTLLFTLTHLIFSIWSFWSTMPACENMYSQARRKNAKRQEK